METNSTIGPMNLTKYFSLVHFNYFYRRKISLMTFQFNKYFLFQVILRKMILPNLK